MLELKLMRLRSPVLLKQIRNDSPGGDVESCFGDGDICAGAGLLDIPQDFMTISDRHLDDHRWVGTYGWECIEKQRGDIES